MTLTKLYDRNIRKTLLIITLLLLIGVHVPFPLIKAAAFTAVPIYCYIMFLEWQEYRKLRANSDTSNDDAR